MYHALIHINTYMKQLSKTQNTKFVMYNLLNYLEKY